MLAILKQIPFIGDYLGFVIDGVKITIDVLQLILLGQFP